MSRIVRTITTDFTVVHNAFLHDKALSITERGMLMTLLSLPDNWNFSIEGLVAILPDGKYKVSKCLNALKDKGYFRRIRLTDKLGKVIDWIYEFSDEPHPEWLAEDEETTAPQSDFSDVTEQDMDNQPQSNIHRSNTEIFDCDNQQENSKKADFKHYNSLVNNNINFDKLCKNHDMIMVSSVKDIILEAFMYDKDIIRVNKTDVPVSEVRDSFMLLKYEHIDNILNALRNKKIRNFRSYVMTSLYNAVQNSVTAAEQPDEFTVYDTDELDFLADACDYAFNNDDMKYISDLVRHVIPYCQGKNYDVALERYDYLHSKYLYVQTQSRRKKIKNKFAYISALIEGDAFQLMREVR